jgi:hypothetical protein
MWIGIVVMPIRIRISILMPALGPILMWILPQVLYKCWKIRILYFYFSSRHCHFTMVYLFYRCKNVPELLTHYAYGIEVL